jgi:hypothetical protein
MFAARRGRLSRARRLYQYALGIAASRRPDSELRATRLYRHALRTLDRQAAARSDGERWALRDAVRHELFRASIWYWLGQRRRRLAYVISALCLALGGLLATVPMLRKTVFPEDLAEGKPWVASSSWNGFAQRGVMTGDSGEDGRFHTNEELYPSVTLDLGATHDVSTVRVANRTNCCRERALPLAIELSRDGEHWSRVGYKRAAFSTWSASFPATASRFVRLRVDRVSTLHLRRIEVY